jgi:hypothetical protein
MAARFWEHIGVTDASTAKVTKLWKHVLDIQAIFGTF